MGKFSLLDVAAIVENTRSQLKGLRVVNVYDISSKKYLIKLSRSNLKKNLLIESGVRIYFTNYEHNKSKIPNGFSQKLRKHLKGKSFQNISQIGAERSVDLSFGHEQNNFHIIFEVYAAGNIVLTDFNYKIIACLRSYVSEGFKMDVGEKYHFCERSFGLPKCINLETIKSKANELINIELNKNVPIKTEVKNNQRSKRNKKSNLSTIILKILRADPNLITHCLLKNNLKPKENLNSLLVKKSKSKSEKQISNQNEITLNEQKCLSILHTTQDCLEILRNFIENKDSSTKKGYILKSKDGMNEKLLTLKFEQFKDREFKEYPTFTEAADEYFNDLESKSSNINYAEKIHLNRIEKVRNLNEERLKTLNNLKDLNEKKGHLLELNCELVDKCIKAVNSKLNEKMSWKDLENFIIFQKTAKNPVASLIKSLELKNKEITLKLRNCTQFKFEKGIEETCCYCDRIYDNKINNNEEINCEEINIKISLNISGRKNSRTYFDKMRKNKEKSDKTKIASKKAIKMAEKKSLKKLQTQKITRRINKMRQKFWFEKFHWFISSDGLLVISGRDKVQNKLILTKMIDPQRDYFVGVELDNTKFVLIKGLKDYFVYENIPLNTLKEAGCIAITKSKIWTERNVISPFWVFASDLNIKNGIINSYGGKINYLPHQRLSFGFTFLFKTKNLNSFKNQSELNKKLNPNLKAKTEIKNEKISLIGNEQILLKRKKGAQKQKHSTCLNCGQFVEKESHLCLYPQSLTYLNFEKELKKSPFSSYFECNQFNELFLDSFTFAPDEQDEIEFLVPMCVPLDYSWKAKYFFDIVPGNIKRGKLVNSILAEIMKINLLKPKNKSKNKNLMIKLTEKEFIAFDKSVNNNDMVLSFFQKTVKVSRKQNKLRNK